MGRVRALIANYFVWLGFYLFTDKITVYHPELDPRKYYKARCARRSTTVTASSAATEPHHVSAYRKFNALQSIIYQIVMMVLVPIQFYSGVLLWDLERFVGSIDLFGGVRVVATVHVAALHLLHRLHLGARLSRRVGRSTWSAHYKAMLTGYEDGGGRARRALGCSAEVSAACSVPQMRPYYPGARLMRHAHAGQCCDPDACGVVCRASPISRSRILYFFISA